MLIVLVTITLIGVIVFVLLTQFNKTEGKSSDEPTIDEILLASIDVPEITTNLSDKRFVRLSLKIQTSSEDAASELTKRSFQTNNIVIQELSEMTEEDLQGKAGKILFEKALKTQLNELMQDGNVEQVYITSYIIQ